MTAQHLLTNEIRVPDRMKAWVLGGPDEIFLVDKPVPQPAAAEVLVRIDAVAMERGLPLKLAGKCREPLEQQYFDELVRPHLSDRIEYVGEVTHGEKVELLQHARATLFPIEWDEPFGLVMIESMACGTPVIATRFGAVPEVIDDGVTGVIVPSWRDMGDALERADAIDAKAQRRIVEERFSPARMVADYVAAYEQTIERWAAPSATA